MNKNVILILVMSLVVFGAIGWMATSHAPTPGGANAAAGSSAPTAAPSGFQVVSVHAGSYGYDHAQLQVKAGEPVEFHFSAGADAGCGRQLILDGFGVNLISRSGEDQVARFTPTSTGRFSYHCGMNMYRGELDVVA